MSLFPFIDGGDRKGNTKINTELPMYKEFAWDFHKNCFIMKDGNFVVVQGIEALRVWIYKALKTQRFKYIIYSWNYGHELEELMGQDYTREALMSEVERHLSECLTINPYIKRIRNVNINLSNDTLNVDFIADTIYGEVDLSVRE